MDLHKAVGQRHHADEEYIQSNGNSAQEHVHLIQTSILLQTICNKSLLHDIDEVEVEDSIHDSEDDLFASIPDVVQVDIGLANLQSSGDPDAEHADVDSEQDKEAEPFELCTVGSNNHQ
jgi:hypothetical protein